MKENKTLEEKLSNVEAEIKIKGSGILLQKRVFKREMRNCKNS